MTSHASHASHAIHAEIEGITATNADGTDRQALVIELAEALDVHGEELPLRLLRMHGDPDNRHAIVVLDRQGRLLGHLGKAVAMSVAEEIDSGTPYRAFPLAVTGGAMGSSYGVSIRIEAVAGAHEFVEA